MTTANELIEQQAERFKTDVRYVTAYIPMPVPIIDKMVDALTDCFISHCQQVAIAMLRQDKEYLLERVRGITNDNP